VPHRRSRRVALLLTLILFLTGCWDRRELEERSNVLVAGVDVCDEGEGCEMVVTRQIAIPGQIPLGGERSGTRQADTVVVMRTPAANAADSLARAQADLNWKIHIGHNRMIVLSEAFARRGVAQYFDYLRRLPELRRLLWLAVAEGRAEDVLKARPALEDVPALYLASMLDDAIKGGRLPQVNVGDFMIKTSNRGEEAVVPILRMAGPDQPELAGLAVFCGSRMVGKLTPEETATFQELQGRRKGGEQLEVTLSPKQNATVSVYGRGAVYRLQWVQGQVRVQIALELESELIRLSPGQTGSDLRTLELIERGAAKMVEERGAALIRKLQHEFGADILSVGERVRAYLPGAWAAIPDWPAAFAGAKFSIDAQVSVRRTGMSMD